MSDQPDEGAATSGEQSSAEPVGAGGQEPHPVGDGTQEPQPVPPTNPLAIAALATAVGGLIIWPVAIVAIVLGVIARRQIEERGERGWRLAIAGIVVGAVSLALTAVAIATRI